MLLSVILIGVTLSMDSALVGITYGIRGTKIPLFSFVVILFFSVFYAGISIAFGTILMSYLTEKVLTILGALIFAILGLNMIVSSFKNKKTNEITEQHLDEISLVERNVQMFKNPQNGDLDHSGVIEPKEAFLLTLALSGDSLVAGIACGMLSVSAWLFPILTGLFETLFLCFGIILGNKLNEKSALHDQAISVLAGSVMLLFALFKIR